MPLSEKQGVGSSILPLATINIGSIAHHLYKIQKLEHFLEHLEYLEQLELVDYVI